MNKIIEDKTGIKNMFKNNKKDELYGVYLLFNYYPECLNELKEQFKEYIKERGLSLYNENNLPNIYIPALISMKNEIDEFIELSFEKDESFIEIENVVFRSLVKNISNEYLSEYGEFCMIIGLNDDK